MMCWYECSTAGEYELSFTNGQLAHIIRSICDCVASGQLRKIVQGVRFGLSKVILRESDDETNICISQ
jgi:hypothetical protein